MQRPAKPCTSVRFRVPPPKKTIKNHIVTRTRECRTHTQITSFIDQNEGSVDQALTKIGEEGGIKILTRPTPRGGIPLNRLMVPSAPHALEYARTIRRSAKFG